MPLNLVRGSRRIGWVVTVPLAAFFVLAFYENTKEFSPLDYEVSQQLDYDAIVEKYGGTSRPATDEELAHLQLRRVEIESYGTAYFPIEVPLAIRERVVKDFVGKRKPEWINIGHNKQPLPWNFTIHKQVSKARLAGLIISAFACIVLVVQGSISILAWVLRGFKG